MATTLNIRLDYGAWPGDEGDTTGSATSREESPAFNHTNQADEFQQEISSRNQESSGLLLSDLSSDSDESVPDEDLLEAEMNMTSSANHPQNLFRPPHPPRVSQGTNLFTSGQSHAENSPVIDLTDSPPRPSLVPSTRSPWRTSPPPPSQEQSTMPPILRSQVEHRRPPPASPPSIQTEERPRKRRRLSEITSASQRPEPSINHPADIDAVDLTNVNNQSDLSKAIAKQQQDAVQSQMKSTQGNDPPGRTSLSSYKCPICMDTPEDATSTICGHLFCHKCIHDTLRFSQQQRRDDAGTSKAKGTCPVCRKALARKDEPGPGRTLVPLEIKLSTKRDLKGKGVMGRVGGGGGGDGGGDGQISSAVPGRLRRAKTERESSADMWRDLTTLEHG